MKKIILFTIAILVMSCNNQKNLNQSVEAGDSKILIGEFNRSALDDNNYSWFNENYKNYNVEQDKINDIKDELPNYKIEVFIGTWCGDSKREFPAFYKILESANFPVKNLKTIALNREKRSDTGLELNKNITHVPTIIVYDRKGKEIGRIVESPVSGCLEEDLAMIIKGKPYTPNYEKQ